MVRIIMNGCNGRMGGTISRLAQRDESARIVCGIDIDTVRRFDYPVIASPAEFSGDADVIIDFSHFSCLEGLLKLASERNIAVVVATTGLSAQHIQMIKDASASIPIFFSANMSLGVNLMIDLVRKATRVLADDFDIEIIERHHNTKLDAPSGTAIAIADALSQELDFDAEYVYDRHSVRRQRGKNEIGIHTVRGGNIVGDHEVIFAGCDEQFSIRHTATSREVFAVGALRAAKFLHGKPAGLYSMSELVNSL